MVTITSANPSAVDSHMGCRGRLRFGLRELDPPVQPHLDRRIWHVVLELPGDQKPLSVSIDVEPQVAQTRIHVESLRGGPGARRPASPSFMSTPITAGDAVPRARKNSSRSVSLHRGCTPPLADTCTRLPVAGGTGTTRGN